VAVRYQGVGTCRLRRDKWGGGSRALCHSSSVPVVRLVRSRSRFTFRVNLIRVEHQDAGCGLSASEEFRVHKRTELEAPHSRRSESFPAEFAIQMLPKHHGIAEEPEGTPSGSQPLGCDPLAPPGRGTPARRPRMQAPGPRPGAKSSYGSVAPPPAYHDRGLSRAMARRQGPAGRPGRSVRGVRVRSSGRQRVARRA
jgi:hypothetical protein